MTLAFLLEQTTGKKVVDFINEIERNKGKLTIYLEKKFIRSILEYTIIGSGKLENKQTYLLVMQLPPIPNPLETVLIYSLVIYLLKSYIQTFIDKDAKINILFDSSIIFNSVTAEEIAQTVGLQDYKEIYNKVEQKEAISLLFISLLYQITEWLSQKHKLAIEGLQKMFAGVQVINDEVKKMLEPYIVEQYKIYAQNYRDHIAMTIEFTLDNTEWVKENKTTFERIFTLLLDYELIQDLIKLVEDYENYFRIFADKYYDYLKNIKRVQLLHKAISSLVDVELYEKGEIVVKFGEYIISPPNYNIKKFDKWFRALTYQDPSIYDKEGNISEKKREKILQDYSPISLSALAMVIDSYFDEIVQKLLEGDNPKIPRDLKELLPIIMNVTAGKIMNMLQQRKVLAFKNRDQLENTATEILSLIDFEVILKVKSLRDLSSLQMKVPPVIFIENDQSVGLIASRELAERSSLYKLLYRLFISRKRFPVEVKWVRIFNKSRRCYIITRNILEKVLPGFGQKIYENIKEKAVSIEEFKKMQEQGNVAEDVDVMEAIADKIISEEQQ